MFILFNDDNTITKNYLIIDTEIKSIAKGEFYLNEPLVFTTECK